MSLPYFLVAPLTMKRLSHFTMQTGIAAAVKVISLARLAMSIFPNSWYPFEGIAFSHFSNAELHISHLALVIPFHRSLRHDQRRGEGGADGVAAELARQGSVFCAGSPLAGPWPSARSGASVAVDPAATQGRPAATLQCARLQFQGLRAQVGAFDPQSFIVLTSSGGRALSAARGPGLIVLQW